MEPVPLRLVPAADHGIANGVMLRRAEGRASSPARRFDRSRVLSAAALLLLVAIPAFAADPTPRAAGPVTVHASVDRDQITIGDPIRYTVEVSMFPDTEVVIPVLSGQLGDFTISDFGERPPRKENGRVISARWYTLTTFTTGDHLIPAPQVQYRPPGEELRTVEGNEVLVGVSSVLAQAPNASDIRDIKPPEEVPFDWRPYGIAAGAVLAVGLLGAAFFYLLNRPRRQRVVPPQPAHEIALAALQRLHRQRLIEEGQFEEYYVRLSAIVRRYLEEGFHLRAPEMTTEEFLSAAATDGRLLAAHRRLLAEFLSQADLVKFARHLPTLRDSEGAYEAAQRFVEDTRPRVPSASRSEVQNAAA
jgi:hypothetical protein